MLFFVSVSIQYQWYGFQNSVLRSIVNLSFVFILFYLHFFLINYFFEKKNFFFYGIIVVAITILSTLARILLNEGLMPMPLDEIVLDRTFSVWFFGFFTAIVALFVSFLYQMVKNRYEKEKKHLDIIHQQNEAQLQYLKAQINPHFLFNTLNNIYSLSVLKSDQTPQMILKLSSLLRYAIYEGEKGKVPLEKEVKQIHEFISLFEMKSETPPNIQFELSGFMDTWKIEPMLLIPLIENCFKHGGFESNENAYAKIKLKVNGNQLIFSTINSLGEDMQKDEVGGIGLSNIQKRLAVNYPNNFELETQEKENDYQVVLKIIKK